MHTQIEYEELEDDIIRSNSERLSYPSEFVYDIKEAFVQFIVIVLLAIHVVCAYAFFCNLLDIKNSLIIIDYLVFIRNISFLIIGFIIIQILKINKSNRSEEPVSKRNTIILYFMIAPFLMIHWLNTTIEAITNGFLIECPGLRFSYLEFLESFFVILILIMLNDIDKMVLKNVSISQKWLNRMVAILIIASCLGIYLLKVGLNILAIFSHRVPHFYKFNITNRSECVDSGKVYSFISDPLMKYKNYTSIATISFSICTIFYLLSLFSWLFSNVMKEYVHHQQFTFRKGRFIFPIIMVVIIITLTILPLPFNSIYAKSETDLHKPFEYISKITLIICYVSTIGLVILMFQEVKLWKNVEHVTSMHQLFIWSGLGGQMFLSIGRIVENIYISEFLHKDQADDGIKMLNFWFIILCIISVLFQTFLMDIMSKRQYQQHSEFSIFYTIQPIALFVGINFSCLINESFIKVWPNTFTTLSANLMADILIMIGNELKLLQRIHAFFYFFGFLDKL